MALQRLEINRLSENGTVLRKIACLSGRISVFRAKTELELLLFAAALQGKQVQERFSITLDDKQFRAAEHIMLTPEQSGFEQDNLNVASYLTQSGMHESDVNQILVDYELEALAQSPLSALNSGQTQILRILSAMQYPNKVLILHNPFEQIPPQLRENIAEALSAYAWNHKAIVVITKLDHRPKCWIENEVVSRIQVERPRQLTIGYGGAEPESVNMIEKIRTELKSGMYDSSCFSESMESKSAIQRVKAFNIQALLKRPKVIVGGFVGILILAGGYINFMNVPAEPIIEKTALKNEPKPIEYELEGYPEAIQQSISTAFNKPETLFPVASSGAPRKELAGTQIKVPVQAFQPDTLDNSEPQDQNIALVPELSEEQMAEQRERIRQNFLEALQNTPQD